MKRPPNGPCHRCDRNGLVWLTPEGKVVARDHLDAYVAFICLHDTRMNSIKEKHQQWRRQRFTDVRIADGDASAFEART